MPRQNQTKLIATKIQMFQWKDASLLRVLYRHWLQNTAWNAQTELIHYTLLQFWSTFVVHIKSKQRLEYDHLCQNWYLHIKCSANVIASTSENLCTCYVPLSILWAWDMRSKSWTFRYFLSFILEVWGISGPWLCYIFLILYLEYIYMYKMQGRCN